MAPRALLILCTLLLLGSAAAAEEESPWLLAPTVSSDPKLGTTVGGVAGYLFRIDPDSDQSLVTTFATYSNTDSFVGGVFGELYWAGNEHQIKAGAVAGEIHNEYDDFLGTGVSFETEDNIHSFFLRYLNHISGHWYGGAKLIVTNYAIGGEGIFDLVLEQIGLTGFDSNGIGLVAE